VSIQIEPLHGSAWRPRSAQFGPQGFLRHVNPSRRATRLRHRAARPAAALRPAAGRPLGARRRLVALGVGRRGGGAYGVPQGGGAFGVPRRGGAGRGVVARGGLQVADGGVRAAVEVILATHGLRGEETPSNNNNNNNVWTARRRYLWQRAAGAAGGADHRAVAGNHGAWRTSEQLREYQSPSKRQRLGPGRFEDDPL